MESRDPYTEGHCERLALNASDLGRHLGLDQESIVALRRGGYLHDLGKIAVPDEILKKGANLTADEWTVMKLHPVTGETICRPLKSLRLVLPIIRSHHEHSDGSGYPDRLAPERNSPAAASAASGGRVRRSAHRASLQACPGHEQAALTMREEARSGFWDEELVGEFLSMLETRRASGLGNGGM